MIVRNLQNITSTQGTSKKIKNAHSAEEKAAVACTMFANVYLSVILESREALAVQGDDKGALSRDSGAISIDSCEM
jgi:hypothetical protein